MILKLAIVCALCILAVVILYFGGVLIYTSMVKINAQPLSDATAYQGGNNNIDPSGEFSIMTWNIGYGGLGKEMDHFYEGGSMTRPPEGLGKKYIGGIGDFIGQKDSVDFVLLQEVDFGSNRSFNRNQAEYLHNILEIYSGSIAINYKSGFVPFPLLEPMGKVSSGLVTFASFKALKASRVLSPATYSWPKRLFMMRRCILISHYPVGDSKELVIINIHNSAYDDADNMRAEELRLIRTIALDEFSKGNYVITGGDWNQNPPGLDLKGTIRYKTHPVRPLENDYFPSEWKYVFDPKLPTNRDVNEPFSETTTLTSSLDYFLVSPNIEAIECKTIDIGFEHSDHLPVIMKFRIKN